MGFPSAGIPASRCCLLIATIGFGKASLDSDGRIPSSTFPRARPRARVRARATARAAPQPYLDLDLDLDLNLKPVPSGLWSQVITALGPYLGRPLPARKAVEDALCAGLAHDAADVREAASKSLVAYNPILGRVAVLTHRGHQRTAFERVLAAQLLSGTWCEAGESWLVDMLNDDQDTVVLAVIDALGKMGTEVAVEPLVLCGQRDSSFKRSAVQAVADIQGRLGDVDGGRLSLSTSSVHAGALSVGQTQGAVSLDTDEPTS